MTRKISKKDLLQTPITQVDPTGTGSVAELLDAYKGMSFQARNLGTCLQVWENALQDEARPTIILGVAGSLMAGGLRRVIRDLVRMNVVDVVVTTGAQPYQDLYAARGHDFWRSSPDADDLLLREHYLDRLYDTLVDEEMFQETDAYLGKVLGESLDPERSYTTREIMRVLGDHFRDVDDSWVAECAREDVPIFVPAINDSSIGIGMVHAYVAAKQAGKPYPRVDPVRDAYELAQITYKSSKTMVAYLGGGIPKNYIQQTEPISDILGKEVGGHHYAIQLTVDSPQWGGLSGCSFEEAQSWGKIAADAKKAQAHVDITIGLPLVATALAQKRHVWENREKLRFVYDGDDLRDVERVPRGAGPVKEAA